MAVTRTVTVIPATINPKTRLPEMGVRRRRVAGYARVSTDKDEQFTSYEAQIDYYTQMIQRNPDWDFVQVYTDEGISGTSIKHREGFNSMVSDALAGKIDLIVTKSVSRFARNTVDSLVTIRKLKEHGVECFFEKENIYTFDGKGELLLTIMSSLAQEESRSISENVTWGQRKRFADGKVCMPYGHFLGYDRGEGKDAPPVINEEQAEIVRKIYRLFIQGKTSWAIAQQLTAEGIPTPSGRKSKWSVSTIDSILTNEKYKGAAILQKTFTVDFLSKKMKANEGEIPQYYVENSHPAIIDPDEWELVQHEFTRRKALGRKYSGTSVFSAKLVCGECGDFYGSKVWNSNSQYRRTVWQCNSKFKGDGKCNTPHLTEEIIKERFVAAVNRLLKGKAGVIANCEKVRDLLTDCTDIDAEIETLLGELEVVTELTRKCIEENAQTAQDQDEYQARYANYCGRYNELAAKINDLQQQRVERQSRRTKFDIFIKSFKKLDGIVTEFNERMWQSLLECVIVQTNGKLLFKFHNGASVEI